MKKKIGLVSLGCAKNLVDSEIMLGLLEKEKFEVTNDEEKANIIIVNTCGFIDSAKEESINTILEMSEFKNNNCEFLIVTGCLAQRYKDEIIKQMPEVDAVVGTGEYGNIAQVIQSAYEGKGKHYTDLNKGDNIKYLNEKRVLSTKNGYAYLKIAEGCDNCCTYCVIPALRGAYKSRKIEDIKNEALYLSQKGVKEIVLIAQDVTSYGKDIYNKKELVNLIRELSQIDEIEWIRLLYCYPEEIDDALIEELSSNSKLVKYIDIPIQHASDNILGKMGRRGTSENVKHVLEKIKEKIPYIVIRTSLIVGFPGEDDRDFKILYDFVKNNEFDRLGVFTYSKEEGTLAYNLKPQIKRNVKESRKNDIMQLQKEIVLKKNKQRINKVYKTLVEGVSDDGIFYYGRTYKEAPDVDGSIYFTSMEPLEIGKFKNVKILNVDQYDLIGEVVNESSQ
ncbi:30S ribosomal protein S12 methylthiotransferase RimO [Herbivorax sp. ANBcel31]|uniref:30S ribosomal protein S12 methylthiotransferase RimO n=1 Tax=Herbivorax sp. ANBcel31 TaxID=3069754 RepID=UPI0027AFDA90|nr:30S ribosomal protein S12 methylthiotransferase RimO [Herbivorax sp. ANBcel31]MDQ2085252.1 30S ribosomal protein S12 methylthiotransferase RimO [Herbivorax sp. ANBcel31]